MSKQCRNIVIACGKQHYEKTKSSKCFSSNKLKSISKLCKLSDQGFKKFLENRRVNQHLQNGYTWRLKIGWTSE